MELIQNGFSCEYEMNVFMKLFFEKDEDVKAETFAEYSNNMLRTYARVCKNGEVYEGKYEYPYKRKDERRDKTVFRCFVVRSFCDAASKIKKVNIPWGALSGIRPAKVIRQMFEAGMNKEEVRKHLSEVFGVKEEKIELALSVAEKEAEILKDKDPRAASIYIGIPFCPSKCLYCSFVSSDMRTGAKYVEEYVALLGKEMKKAAGILKELDFYVENIYIGGGTPTAVSADKLERILEDVNKYFDLSKTKEFTLEAGRADTITEEKLVAAKRLGVDRISINPQTMNENTLKIVGRNHTAKDVVNAFNLARKSNFENINMDLIAGLPGENAEIFKNSLEEVIKLDPENITVHSLCIKRAAALRLSEYGTADPYETEKMLSYTQKRMKETGRAPYYMYRQKNISGNLENVGYAKEGYHSFYNVNIMEEVQNILALGGGGASKIVKNGGIDRVFNFKDACEYIKRFDEILEKKDEFKKIYIEM